MNEQAITFTEKEIEAALKNAIEEASNTPSHGRYSTAIAFKESFIRWLYWNHAHHKADLVTFTCPACNAVFRQ